MDEIRRAGPPYEGGGSHHCVDEEGRVKMEHLLDCNAGALNQLLG